MRGDQTINDAQSEVVRRIFRDYAAGKSAKTIAFALNKESTPVLSDGYWGFIRSKATRSAGTVSSTPRCMSTKSSGTVSAS